VSKSNKVVKLNEQRKLKIARGNTVASGSVKNFSVSWAELKDRLSHTTVTAESFDDYMMLGETKQGRKRQDTIKDVGFIVAGHMAKGRRKKANISSVSLIMLDLDDAPADVENQLKARLGDITFFAYSTHKHCPEAPRARIVIPLLREVTVEEHEPVSRALANKLDMDWIDPTTHQASRAMHYPSTSSDGVFYKLEHEAITWADPDAILAEYDDWRDMTQWPTGPNENKELRLKADKAENPLTKKGVVGAFCRAYTIREAIEEFIPGVYEETMDGRYSYTAGSTANGAVTYDDKFLYSHHSTDPCGDILVNAFDVVRIHLYGDKDKHCSEGVRPTRRPSYKAFWEQLKNNPLVKAELLEAQLPDFGVGDGEFDDDDADLASLGLDDPDKKSQKVVAIEAKKALKQALTLNEYGKTDPSLGNLVSILDYDPTLRGCAAYNVLITKMVLIKDLPEANFDNKLGGMLWNDRHTILVKLYIERQYCIKVSVGLVDEALGVIARRNAFHPFRDYLRGLKWDGQFRLDTLLTDHLECEDNAYTRAAGAKWVIAAVARCFDPGTKFDHMLILEGPQGIGKSTFCETLLPNPEWFTDNLADIANKSAAENIQGKIIVEVGELNSLSGKSAETAKAFISRTEDRYRPAYAKYAEDFPRQCVFIGTTNRANYLKDATGNRRYWPIKAKPGTFQVFQLKQVRDQLWAEAVARYKSGETLYLEGAALKASQQEQFERLTEVPFVMEISGLINNPVQLRKPHSVIESGSGPDGEYFPGGFTEQGIDGNLYLSGITANGLKEMIPELREASNRRGGKFIISDAMGRTSGWVKAEKKERFCYGEISKRGGLKKRDAEYWYKRIGRLPTEDPPYSR